MLEFLCTDVGTHGVHLFSLFHSFNLPCKFMVSGTILATGLSEGTLTDTDIKGI